MYITGALKNRRRDNRQGECADIATAVENVLSVGLVGGFLQCTSRKDRQMLRANRGVQGRQ